MNLIDRYRGAMLGLATGDALGTTLEFKPPGSFTPIDDMVGGGPFHLEPGQWTDDTSMALCLAESLVERGTFDAVDQLERYVRWWREGHLSSNGTCFDIGNTVSTALARFRQSKEPVCGSTEPSTAGNGSLMRLAPVPLAFAFDRTTAIDQAAASSRTTHAAVEAVDACRLYTAMILAALDGASKDELVARGAFDDLFQQEPLAPKVATISAGSYLDREPPAIRGTGYVIASLEAALWAFSGTGSFREGALAAVNLGDDADTTGAIYGQLAGAHYGVDGIPKSWRERLAQVELIEDFAQRLLALRLKLALGSWAPPDAQHGRPIGNAYWVRHGKLLAGEYPGGTTPSEAREKLRKFLGAGVTYFVDLTGRGELAPYAELLREERGDGQGVAVHRRFAIVDAGLPDSPTQMVAILDAIDAAIAEGHVVYVHCWGGIGRTGTVVGCHLVRHGLGGDEALAALGRLWGNVDKVHRQPRSPETDAQADFVRRWREP